MVIFKIMVWEEFGRVKVGFFVILFVLCVMMSERGLCIVNYWKLKSWLLVIISLE